MRVKDHLKFCEFERVLRPSHGDVVEKINKLFNIKI